MDSTRVTIAALLSLCAVWFRVVRAIDPETEQSRCRTDERRNYASGGDVTRAARPRSGARAALCPMLEARNPVAEGGGVERRAARGRAARLGLIGSALCGETLPLHVAPELLGHLGWADRLGAE